MTVTIRSTPSAVFNPHTQSAPNQTAPAVAALAAGGYVTLWRSDGQDNGVAGEGGVYSRVADASGAFVGGEILVNTTTAGSQSMAGVEALPGGGYVVSWISGPAGATVAYLQRFDSTGAKVGGETLVGATGAQVQSVDIASLGDNGFWAVWSGGGGVSAQHYDPAGGKVGDVVSITNSEASRNPVRADAAADGDLLVAWTGRDASIPNPFISIDQVKVRHVDATGAVGPEVVSTYPDASMINTINPTVTALSGGGYVAAWAPLLPARAFYQMYDANGQKVGALREASSGANAGGIASIAPLADGGFVIGWNGSGGVRLQIVGADGERIGNEVVLAARLDNTSDFLAGMSLTVLEDGSIVAAWHDRATGSPADIKMVRLDAAHTSTLSANVEIATGGAADDVFLAAPGAIGAGDMIAGGDGVDRLELTEAGVLDLTAAATFDGLEIIAGSAGDDLIMVSTPRLAGITDIFGGAGDDTVGFAGDLDLGLVNLVGIETVRGSGGDDRLVMTASADVAVDGGAGFDTIALTASAIQDLTAARYTSVEVVQGTHNDQTFRLAGGEQGFRVDGNGGYTVVSYETATSGAVMSLGHIGATVVAGSAYADRLVGGGGADVVNASDGDDLLIGYGGADTLNGQGGADIIYGQGGDDILSGGSDTTGDFLFGGAGNDVYNVSSTFQGATDIVFEGGDNPDIMAGAGDVDVVHSFGNYWRDYYSVGEKLFIETTTGSQMVGGVNNQEIYGAAGNDVILPYGGSNRIDAGAGTDVIDLGLHDLDESYDGVNTVVMKAGSGIDYVYGFESGVDKIDLTAFHFGITGQQVLDQAVNVDLPGTADDHVYFYLSGAGGVDNYIVFMGLQSNQLHASDFVT